MRNNAIWLSAAFFLVTSLTLIAQTTTGVASYYAAGLQGRKTASGEPYDHQGFTCANRDYPFGTELKVIRVDDGRSVVVRVNDCGPHRKDRIIDVSGAAAEQIGLVRDGITLVRLELVKMGTGKMPCGKTRRPAASKGPTSYGNEGTPATPATAPPPPPIEGQGTYRAEVLRPIEAGFGVQVGSYRVYENAAEVAADLQAKGYSKVLIRLQGNVHQVVLGPFNTHDSAEEYRKNLLAKYQIRGFVTEIKP
ncbi:MAG: hypothetical protein DA408_00125 [Bacteroidetes bacterium]|nr:MAG: hypothetical protein C7N36_03365 [Bacteroidota bacterium]PTM15063.1 MAG: hypothetical protein DA408_00125 [Bacteroidota bacterium]